MVFPSFISKCVLLAAALLTSVIFVGCDKPSPSSAAQGTVSEPEAAVTKPTQESAALEISAAQAEESSMEPEPTADAEVVVEEPKPVATVGGGTLEMPAVGPGPAYDYGDDTEGYILVKNWDFGKNGTITNNEDLSEHFQFHDQFGCISNGRDNYGAYIVAPFKKDAITAFGVKQPVEGINTDRPVREYTEDSMKTFLVGLDGSTEVHPTTNKAGNGSFQAKWTLPRGGKLLGQDLIYETRVRYKTPPYFWFAIWTCGDKWRKGAEMDVVEGFGYDNGGGHTNYDGRYWHSSLVKGIDGSDDINYKNWEKGMKTAGVTDFDGEQYHVWTWVYKADDTFVAYMDGIPVQSGYTPWTLRAEDGGEPINMSFIFDGSWGHSKIDSVNRPLPVSAFDDTFYEWDYSRIYLRNPPEQTSASNQ